LKLLRPSVSLFILRLLCIALKLLYSREKLTKKEWFSCISILHSPVLSTGANLFKHINNLNLCNSGEFLGLIIYSNNNSIVAPFVNIELIYAPKCIEIPLYIEMECNIFYVVIQPNTLIFHLFFHSLSNHSFNCIHIFLLFLLTKILYFFFKVFYEFKESCNWIKLS
jgi:hypothetical protein